MQFSDSTSSSSSESATPRRGCEGHLVGLNAPKPFASASRAFHGTYSSERRGADDKNAQRLSSDSSSLQIQPTAGLGTAGSRVSVISAACDGANGAGDDSKDDLHLPFTQQAPPFFAGASAASSAAQTRQSKNSAGKLDVKAFHMVRSSSSTSPASSASSLSTGPPHAKKPTGRASATKRLQLRPRSASETSSEASATSPSTPLDPSARQSGSSRSSFPASSLSDVAFHRLGEPHAASVVPSLPAAAAPAASVPPAAHHQNLSSADAMMAPATADASATPSVHRSAVEKSTRAVTVNKLVDTGSNGTAGANLLTSTSPEAAESAAMCTRASEAQATVSSTSPGVPPTSQVAPSTSAEGSPPSDSLLSHIQSAVAVHRNAVYSSYEDVSDDIVDEDELNSSAGSRAAQAALEAAEQLRRSEGISNSSPVLTAMTEHSFPITTSLPPAQVETSSPPFRVLASEGELGCAPGEENGCDSIVTENLVSSSVDAVHIPLKRGRELASRAECCNMDSAAVTSHHATATRRQPPPPPTPSTTTKKSPSSSSAMRRGVKGDDSASSGGDSSDNELTVKQPNQLGTTSAAFTSHPAPAEATRAVVNYSASLLPPSRSSSSASHSSGKAGDNVSTGGGHGGGDGSTVLVSVKNARDTFGSMSSGSSTSSTSNIDTRARSPPRQTMMRCSDRVEDDAVGGGVGSVASPSTAMTAGGAVMGSGSEDVAGGVIAPGPEQHLLHYLPPPAPAFRMQSETPPAVTAFPTLTRGGETSSQRASAVLMPPSPSQPRAAMMPDDSSSSSYSLIGAAADAGARQLDRSTSGQALPVVEGDAAAQPSESDGVRRVLVMRRMSDSIASSSSFSSGSAGGKGSGPRQTIGNRRTREASSEYAYIQKDGDSSEGRPSLLSPAASSRAAASNTSCSSSPVQPPTPALCVDATCMKDMPTVHARAFQYTEGHDASTASEREEDEDGTLINGDAAEKQDGSPLELQVAGRWDGVLSEMELVDCTIVSRVYQRAMPHQRTASRSDSEADEGNAGSDDDDDELCLFKVVSLFPIATTDHCARWPRRTQLQRRLLALAAEMRATQRALDEAGLTAAVAESGFSTSRHMDASEKGAIRGENVDSGEADADDVFAQRRRRTTCAGVSEVYVDSSCRLIAQLEVASYMVPLRHLVAASCGTGFREKEVLALIRTVVCKVATMHNAGFVHGALHAGNVLLSSYDGDAVLTQPCGLMSQSVWLPSDLSVISVTRAYAMASYLPRVWGARRLHAGAAAPARLGPQQPLSTAELITHHNLAALGWLNHDDAKAAVGPNGKHESCESSMSGVAYIPTAADDLYAIGMIAFLVYLGIPPFHMVSLWAAVERLGVLRNDYMAAMQSSSSSPTAARLEARRLVAEFCFGARQRDAGANSGPTQSAGGVPASSGEFMQLPDLLTRTCAVMQRHAVAAFRPDFERALQSFIVDCVEASCSAAVKLENGSPSVSGVVPRVYANAQELLTDHPLFRNFSLPAQAGEDGEKEQSAGGGWSAVEEESQLDSDERMRDTVHRVAYPAFCTWARARDDCGSAPYLSRLHSNALFTARCTALCEHVSAAASYGSHAARDSPDASWDSESWSVLSVLSPHMAGAPPAWHAPFPYGGADTGCREDLKADTGTSKDKPESLAAAAIWHRQWRGGSTAVAAAARLSGLSLLVRPSAPSALGWLAARENSNGGADAEMLAAAFAEQEEDALAAQLFSRDGYHAPGDFEYHPHLRALSLAGQKGGSFSLSRAFVLSRVLPVADTLVLQHLADCKVTLLAPFRYVVLDALQRCEVRLGPCESCVLRDVHNCQLIAVAARHLSGNHVTETHVSWSEQGSGRLLLTRSGGVTTSLYGLVYEGLVEDYSRVGLPLEHAACFDAAADVTGDSAEVDDAVGFRGPALARWRTVELSATTATGVSRGQTEVGLCLAPEAPYAHALLVSNSRYVYSGRCSGGFQRRWMPPPDVFHFFGELREKDMVVCDVHGGTRDGDARPVVFVVGALGDVVVERCSHCTIVVAGTASNLQASECHDCQLVFMARESVVEACARMECVALVTEYLLLRRCDAVRVRPLFLECPFSDEVLRHVVDGSVGGAEEEMVVGAYEAGRLDELNAVLRGVGQGVHVDHSEKVVVEDMAYFYQLSPRTGDVEDDEREGGADGDGLSVLSVTYASMQSPVTAALPSSDASQLMADAAQSLAEHLSVPCYIESLQRYGGEERDAAGHACRPTVSFHDLLNCSVLRLRESLCPLKQQASSASRDSTLALVDICVERVHGGVIYVEDAVHTLCLRHCVGPLDVVVCAAATVLMEACVGVQLRTACVGFHATDCVDCHVALHVNDPPQYQRCRGMQTSALNITARDFDALLTAAGVDLATNRYDAPLLRTEEWERTVAAGPSGALLGTGVRHAVDSDCVDPSTAAQSTADICAMLLASVHRAQGSSRQGGLLGGTPRVSPDQLQLILSVLRQPVTVVAPLPGLCVSPDEAPFLEELETRVAAWAKRAFSVSREEAVDVALYALADVAEGYTGFTEWAAPTDSVQPTEAPEMAAASGASLDPDAPPQLLITRAPPSTSATSSASTDQQLLMQSEKHHTMGNASAALDASAVPAPSFSAGDASGARTSTPATPSLLQVDVERGSATEEEDSEEEVAMHRAPTPPLRLPSAHYADPMSVSTSGAAHTSPAGGPRAATVALHRPPQSGSSPMRARHGELASFESATPPCATRSDVGSSANGLDCAASATEDDTSVNSSVAAPPLPPGPAYALDPTNFGASSTMDVFYRTQRDAMSVATGTTGPFMEDDGGAYSVAAHMLDDEGLGLTSASAWPDHTRSPVITGGGPALVSPMGSSGGHVCTWSGQQASSVAETLTALHAEPRDQWPPSSRRSPRRMKLDQRGNSNADELLTAPTAHGRATTAAGAKVLPATLVGEGSEPPCAGNAAYGSLRTSSSSVAEYPRRGVTSYENSAEHVVGSDGGGAEESPLPQTNFLHVSQDSSSRRLETDSPAATITLPTVMEAGGGEDGGFSRAQNTVVVPPAGEGVVVSKAHLPALNLSPEVKTMHEADVNMKDVLQHLQQARQLFARNQQSWQSPNRGGLEARVRAVVAKLTALKATCAKTV
ncbi:hypothetical protein JIQ42_07006 [Leishmania sp. Namibia]|uniref:hypothetical protein n=1 Tax=Leishmania sp. Namibia TaxID=2802991 RepID=UPI001B648D24|nr:hypothetical protein JIQ42_07006 [Leishmania sp. Namibia]